MIDNEILLNKKYIDSNKIPKINSIIFLNEFFLFQISMSRTSKKTTKITKD